MLYYIILASKLAGSPGSLVCKWAGGVAGGRAGKARQGKAGRQVNKYMNKTIYIYIYISLSLYIYIYIYIHT